MTTLPIQLTPSTTSLERPFLAAASGIPGTRDRHVTRSRWPHRRNRPQRLTWKS